MNAQLVRIRVCPSRFARLVTPISIFVCLLAAHFLPPVSFSQEISQPRVEDGKTPAEAVSRQHWRVSLRSRDQGESSGRKVQLIEQTWDPAKTALIVCDMWDLHHCLNATKRVGELAPRMNRVLESARAAGAIVIHAPSSCIDHYRDHPARANAERTPASPSLPEEIGRWLNEIDAEDMSAYPIDQSDGGEDDLPAEHEAWAKELAEMGRNPRAPWTRQVDQLQIADSDYISDSGEEIWSILEAQGRDNVILMGVHTNMCVLGRPFGLRQMARNGKNVVLMRDLTDTMYNPQRWPYVTHFQGTDLIVRHIETYVCPTITSAQLIGGDPFRFAGDDRPQVTLLIAEDLYQTQDSLRSFADETLRDQMGFECTTITASGGRHQIDGLAAALPKTDLLILSVRRRALPAKQLRAVRDYLARGGALLAIRTSSHAFDARGNHPEGHAEWPEFDGEVLGGNYTGHHPDGPIAEITSLADADDQPLLTDVALPFSSVGSLYKSSPLAADADTILVGTIDGQPAEPVAWTRQFGEAKIFYTSLGHVEDFANGSFQQLLKNGVRWATGMKIGREPETKR